MTRLTDVALTAACLTLVESSRAESQEGRVLEKLCAEAATHRADVATSQLADPEAEFAGLVQRWKRDCMFESSTTKMILQPAYQQIIGMGDKAVPLLLREMEREPDHWGWALHAITRVDPVRREDAGRLAKIAEAWLAWGRGRGLRW